VLLLDLDNTLIDRDAAFRRYLADCLARHAAAFAGQSRQDKNDRQAVMQEIIALDAHGRTPRAQFCSALLQRYPALPFTPDSLWHDHQRILDHFEYNAAIPAMLLRLATRYRLGLISNGSGPMQRRKLRDAGIESLFALVLISGEAGVAKPQAEIFQRALSFFHADSATMVGDDPHNDIRPAHALGLATIHIALPGDTPEALADHVLTDILHLEETLSCST
jgi:putative hydrolase of the HAD superfamily